MRIDKDAIRREQARLLREQGMSIREIAELTHLPMDVVRKLCRGIIPVAADPELPGRMANGEACPFCGHSTIQHGGSGRPRRFCSEHCRRQYWRLHRDEQKKSPKITFAKFCKYCGRPFEVYGKNDRKYCCRDHYLKHFHGECREDNREDLIKKQLAELTRLLA